MEREERRRKEKSLLLFIFDGRTVASLYVWTCSKSTTSVACNVNSSRTQNAAAFHIGLLQADAVGSCLAVVMYRGASVRRICRMHRMCSL